MRLFLFQSISNDSGVYGDFPEIEDTESETSSDTISEEYLPSENPSALSDDSSITDSEHDAPKLYPKENISPTESEYTPKLYPEKKINPVKVKDCTSIPTFDFDESDNTDFNLVTDIDPGKIWKCVYFSETILLKEMIS